MKFNSVALHEEMILKGIWRDFFNVDRFSCDMCVWQCKINNRFLCEDVSSQQHYKTFYSKSFPLDIKDQSNDNHHQILEWNLIKSIQELMPSFRAHQIMPQKLQNAMSYTKRTRLIRPLRGLQARRHCATDVFQ